MLSMKLQKRKHSSPQAQRKKSKNQSSNSENFAQASQFPTNKKEEVEEDQTIVDSGNFTPLRNSTEYYSDNSPPSSPSSAFEYSQNASYYEEPLNNTNISPQLSPEMSKKSKKKNHRARMPPAQSPQKEKKKYYDWDIEKPNKGNIKLKCYCKGEKPKEKSIPYRQDVHELCKELEEIITSSSKDNNVRLYFDTHYEGMFSNLVNTLQEDLHIECHKESKIKHPEYTKQKFVDKEHHVVIKLSKKYHSTKISFGFFLPTLFLLVVAVGVCLYLKPELILQNHPNWMFSQTRLEALQLDLEATLPEQPEAVTRIVDALSNHYGEKPVVLHFVGRGSAYVDIIIRKISKNLLGSETNDQVLQLHGGPETMQESLYRHIEQWKRSLIVLHLDAKRSFEGLDYLTGVFNDNHAAISLGRFNPLSTKSSIFIVVSNVLSAGELDKFQPTWNGLEVEIKKRLKEQGWPDRVCQRLQYSIPFV